METYTPQRRKVYLARLKELVPDFLFATLWKNPDMLAQVSYLSRALPLPTKLVCDEALEKYRVITHNTFVPVEFPAGLRESFRVGLDWVDAHTPAYPDEAFPVIGTSSCLQYSTREGGRTRYIREILADDLSQCDFHTVLDKIDVEEHPGPVSWPPRTDGGALIETKVIDDYIQDRLVPVPITALKTVVVKELGFKARIVTKADARNVTLAHQVRKKLFRALQTVRALAAPLNAQYEITGLIKSNNKFVFSADLSNATDTLSHDVLNMLCCKLGIPGCYVHHVEDEFGRWKRGCPMGLPASWAILSIIHYVICHHVDPTDQFRLAGDDLLSYWTLRSIRRYRKCIAAVGLIINDKKSFKSRTRGLFCERHYLLELDSLEGGKEIYVLRPIDRGLFSLRIVNDKKDNLSVVAGSLAKAREFHNRIGTIPMSRLLLIQKVTFFKEIKNCSRYGLDPYCPMFLAGLGLVPKNFYKQPSLVYQHAYANMHNNPNEYKLSFTVHSCDPFSSAQAWASEFVTNSLRQLDVIISGASHWVPIGTQEFTGVQASRAMLRGLLLTNKNLKPPKAKYLWEALRSLRLQLQYAGSFRSMHVTYRGMYDLESRFAFKKAEYLLLVSGKKHLLDENQYNPLVSDRDHNLSLVQDACLADIRNGTNTAVDLALRLNEGPLP
jgi:hypothetical protein